MHFQVGREETNQRLEVLENIEKLKKEKECVLKELQKYKDSDPEVLEQMKVQIKVTIFYRVSFLY